MPGFDILQQPFQYHPPQAPVVPVADNTAAKIISAGTDTAVNAFLKAAVARRQADLEAQQQAQTAALTLRAQDIAQENNQLDFKVGMANAQSLADYRAAGGGSGDAATRAAARFELFLQQQAANDKRTSSVNDISSKGMAAIDEAGLNDEQNWIDRPVESIDKLMHLQGRYGNIVEGPLVDEFKRLNTRADQLKVSIRSGASFKPEYYGIQEGDISGKQVYHLPQWTGGDLEHVPLRSFVQQWRYHPEERPKLWQSLVAAGNISVVDQLDKTKGPHGTLTHKQFMDPKIQAYLKAAEEGTFLKDKSEVPTELTAPAPKTSLDYGGEEAPLPGRSGAVDDGTVIPEPDLPPTKPGSSIESPSGTAIKPGGEPVTLQPTDTDKVIGYARAAIQRGAPIPAVAQRLKSMNIDPNQLWA